MSNDQSDYLQSCINSKNIYDAIHTTNGAIALLQFPFWRRIVFRAGYCFRPTNEEKFYVSKLQLLSVWNRAATFVRRNVIQQRQ